MKNLMYILLGFIIMLIIYYIGMIIKYFIDNFPLTFMSTIIAIGFGFAAWNIGRSVLENE